jgi:potassium-dependent mechanosensitive channel
MTNQASMTLIRFSNSILKIVFFLASFLTIVLLCRDTVLAQTFSADKKENKTHRKKIIQRHLRDSVWQKNLNITDTSSAKAISRIQDMNSTLNDFNDVVDEGYDSTEITENLPVYERKIKSYQVNFANLNNNLNLSRLSYMQVSLDDMEADLKDWETSLLAYYTELVGMNAQMRGILLDSGMRSLPLDTTLRILYIRQLNQLKKRFHATDTVTRKNLLKIDLLQSKVSNDYLEVVALQKQIGSLVKAYRKKAFSKESGYLWEGPSRDTASVSLGVILENSLSRNGHQLGSYLPANWDKYIINLPIFLLFFCWAFINIKKIRISNPGFLTGLRYIQSLPLLTSLTIMFIITPYLDLQHPPTVYIELVQFLLVIVLTLLLLKKWPRKLFSFWLILVALFVFFAAKVLMASSSYPIRLFTFFVTVFSILLGISFFRLIKNYPDIFPGYFRGITGIYILLNMVAAGCNLFGRATLAHIFETTAISNYIEAIGLILFINIFLEAVKLQLEADKKSTRFTAYLNYQNIGQRLRRLLTTIAGILWGINLLQNLNIFDSTYDSISEFLGTERSVGNTSFTFGSILVFFAVIWVANFFQKYIGYFFGDTGSDEIINDKKPKLGVSVLLVRLLILTAGFFLGILASGIPLDKVTIVIGALGVGIGLGLQNIVNNLVSGVILAIERPIQVGDIIDISGNTGRVKEIGIRSSRIVTPDGAEIIIPNGDMLSQKLTNWTLNNSHLRVELDIKLANGSNLERAKEIISGILKGNAGIMQVPEPQLLFKNINQTGADLQILFWAFDINKWVQLKSDALQQVFEACNKENISII